MDIEHKKISYHVRTGHGAIPDSPKLPRGAKFRCIMCGEITQEDYIKQEATNGRMGAVQMAVVAEGTKGRLYLSSDEEQQMAACCEKPQTDYPEQSLPFDPRNIWCVNYGLDTYDKLFTQASHIEKCDCTLKIQ